MCGIAGIVARRNSIALEQAVGAMTASVRHRGPDDEGVSVYGRVAIGHRRLSIIDLSANGHQPMEYDDGRYAITYNGEVYNYLELRAELKAQGFCFRSNTDTEVILAAYSAWGPECLSRFNGMWAFAIHDRRENVVFAARDRFGVKPFYYILTDRCFAFGSEIRELLPLLPSVGADIEVVLEYLHTGVHVQSERTFFVGVCSLLPGHWLLYDVDADSLRLGRYYDLGQRVKATEPASEAEAIDDFRSTFEDAVALRLRSDVQVGTCLSGGLDSSSIALLAARLYAAAHGNRRFAAITAVSEDPRNSEETYARCVAESGSLAWITTRPDYDDFRRLLPHVVEHQEEPFGSPSICLQAFVMRAAREHGVVVLLDGQGGDETLLGYDRYYAAYILALWRESGLCGMLKGVRASIRNNENLAARQLAAYFIFGLVPAARYSYYRRRHPFLSSAWPLPEWVRSVAAASWDLRDLQVLEVEKTALPRLLYYEDKNSMAYAIETRLPFLDYRLVEKAIAMAPALKMRDGWTKYVLRAAMGDVLPPDVAWRRKKIGFEAPTEIWLSRHLAEMTQQVRNSSLLQRICNTERLRQAFPGVDRNTQWRLYSLSLWEQAFGVAS